MSRDWNALTCRDRQMPNLRYSTNSTAGSHHLIGRIYSSSGSRQRARGAPSKDACFIFFSPEAGQRFPHTFSKRHRDGLSRVAPGSGWTYQVSNLAGPARRNSKRHRPRYSKCLCLASGDDHRRVSDVIRGQFIVPSHTTILKRRSIWYSNVDKRRKAAPSFPIQKVTRGDKN